MLAGRLLDYAEVHPLKLLFWSAVFNGVLAPPLLVIILLVSNNRRVMGVQTNSTVLNVCGLVAATVMSLAAVALFISWR